MMLQLNPPVPLLTPKGTATAHVLIDRGQEHHLVWVTFIDATGECWSFQNTDVRLPDNWTMHRGVRDHEWPAVWDEQKAYSESKKKEGEDGDRS